MQRLYGIIFRWYPISYGRHVGTPCRFSSTSKPTIQTNDADTSSTPHVKVDPKSVNSTREEEFLGHIPIDSLQISYSCSSGPGGQHVNKSKCMVFLLESVRSQAKSKVEIRFHVPSASWIPDVAKQLILEKEAHRLTKDQYFVISSDRTRKQILNQADCLERIRRMIREYVNSAKKPIPDPETLELIGRRLVAQNESRLREKKSISFTKQQRQKPTLYDL
ncbi:Immature colon carcinoma transcript 1 protein [Fasciola hepatica]|uniref:Large ribosomal subunit protein mL62 n=1 Tax=Fasciola hepatica TaxID=6192 RepID=A0A4E0RVP8_FASHE|nr:Immature colon carcinoma transcript 1 protein [Fasciola hepatica]